MHNLYILFINCMAVVTTDKIVGRMVHLSNARRFQWGNYESRSGA